MVVSFLAEADRVLPPGTVFRFHAAWPYEAMVDFMLYQHPGGTCGLMVTTGIKSGFVAVILPEESLVEGYIGVEAKWLSANWSKWVWPEGDATQVQVVEGYPPPLG